MSIERTYYCEGPDCNAHVQTATPPPYLVPGLLEVREGEPDARTEAHHFCCWDCLMKYAAGQPIPERIDFDRGEPSE